MIHEGFFDNIGANPLSELRRVIVQIIDGTLSRYSFKNEPFKNEPSIKKYLPNPTVSLSDKNILSLGSAMYPDITYDFDITPAINDIMNAITSAGINIGKVNWEKLNIGYPSGPYMEDRINVKVWVNKDKMTVRIYGPAHPISLYFNDDQGGEIKFKANHIFQEEVKVSPISVCMDLRTSLTKYITDLQKGTITPINVKRNIEEYIKKLK